MWTLAQVFNPAYAASHLSPHGVDALSDIKPLHYHKLIDGMKREVHAYLTACAGVVIDSSDMHTFTNSVLMFWRNNAHKFPTWSKAARIMVRARPRPRPRPRPCSCCRLNLRVRVLAHNLHVRVLAHDAPTSSIPPVPPPRAVCHDAQLGRSARPALSASSFSLLKHMFPDTCNLSLADLIEGSLMLKYNNAKRAAEKTAITA